MDSKSFPAKKKTINDISFARVIFMPFLFNGYPEECGKLFAKY